MSSSGTSDSGRVAPPPHIALHTTYAPGILSIYHSVCGVGVYISNFRELCTETNDTRANFSGHSHERSTL